MKNETIITFANILVTYITPIAALILSAISVYRSNKISKLEEKINEYDLKLKQYELKKIESSMQKRARVEANIVRISKSVNKIRIYNIGNENAYQVDYDIPKEYQIILCKDDGVTPVEVLKPGDSFDQNVVVHMESRKKYEVITTWKDTNGKDYSLKEIKVRS